MQVFQREYHGFESWADIGRDMDELWHEPSMKNVPSEGQGTLKITVEYVSDETDHTDPGARVSLPPQEPLGYPFKTVLADNLWNLYEE